MPRFTAAAVVITVLLPVIVFTEAAPAGSVLHWTAPGDNGSTGTARCYDVRRSTQPITDATFALADTVAGCAVPHAAGAHESLCVALPQPNTPYYFAIKTADAAGNWSAMSNVVSLTRAVLAVDPGADAGTRLAPPAPNPARGRTSLRLELPAAAAAAIDVFDVAGRRVRALWRGDMAAGAHALAWDLRDDFGRRVAGGVFVVRAQLGGIVRTRRLVVVD